MSFDHGRGWVRLDLLSTARASSILDECSQLLVLPAAERAARDKVTAGTQHLFDLDRRLDSVVELLLNPTLDDVVSEIVGPRAELGDVGFRCPGPGHGAQKLHADDVPKLDDDPARVATAIVALVDFTTDNGATRVVDGSHRRPDLQASSGGLDSHPEERVLTGPAGSAFVFSGHLLHGGGQNNSSESRPALRITWRRGSVAVVDRSG